MSIEIFLAENRYKDISSMIIKEKAENLFYVIDSDAEKTKTAY